MDVVLGGRTHRFSSGDWLWSTALDGAGAGFTTRVLTALCAFIAVPFALLIRDAHTAG